MRYLQGISSREVGFTRRKFWLDIATSPEVRILCLSKE